MVGEKPYVMQGTVRHGFNNLVTGYGGATVSEHYLAGQAGAALNTAIGAFSLDATHAKAKLKNQPDRTGQSYSLSYARFFEPTRTSVTRSEEHTSELQSLMRISYAVFYLKKK